MGVPIQVSGQPIRLVHLGGNWGLEGLGASCITESSLSLSSRLGIRVVSEEASGQTGLWGYAPQREGDTWDENRDLEYQRHACAH